MWTVRIENKIEVDLFFKNMEAIKSVRVLNALATAVGHHFRKQWKTNFDREQIDDYRTGIKKWKELKPATKAQRIRQGFGVRPILQRSGRLFKALTRTGTPENINRVNNGRGEFGASVFYAIYHQSHKPRRVLPRRQMIGVARASINAIARMGSAVVRFLPEGRDKVTWRKIYNFSIRGILRRSGSFK